QIILGGLVAGLKAGLIYNSFPLMGGRIIPYEVMRSSFSEYLYNPAVIQFFHRMLGCIIGVFILIFSAKLITQGRIYMGLIVCLLFFLQIYLGIYTLLYHVPVMIALLHQIMAFILIGSLIVAKIHISLNR
ncbi:MAG: COX15/CtaA family protein, partial [Rickettsiaceae bacterium]|nr:COX15/CtaA family protein [Rickettsiaceae bacterium]